MKLSHIISSIDVSTGGPARSSTSLVRSLLEFNTVESLEILTIMSEQPFIKGFENKKGKVKFFESSFLDYSSQLSNYLNKRKDIDIFHTHGIWGLPMHQAAMCARKYDKPYIISIRGMLEPWSLGQSKLKKKLAMLLYQYYDLKKAACLHATADMEAKSIRDLGYKNPIAVIPNGIDLSEYPLKDFSIKKNKRKILFLSRIHPKKGIEYLIEAWERLEPSIKLNWEIEIAGNGDKDYIQKLNTIIVSKSLDECIKITGPQFGEDKINTYHNADLFVLPTHSENFGIVIAEALSCGVPVITTHGTPWEDIKSYNAGDWIEIGVDPLVRSLEIMMIKDEFALQQMGINGRRLIEEEYSIESVAAKMFEVYKWILNKTDKPKFVKS